MTAEAFRLGDIGWKKARDKKREGTELVLGRTAAIVHPWSLKELQT